MPLQFERLEDRRLMSAQLLFSGGGLRIIANDMPDEILIVSTGTAGGVKVFVDQDGMPGTEYGQEFTAVVAITAALRGGDDELTIRGVSLTNGINIDAGDGLDRVQVQSVNLGGGLAVSLGAGDDDFTLTGSAVIAGPVRVYGFAGQDEIEITSGARVRGLLAIDGGEQGDQMAIANNVRIDGNASLILGGGTNQVRVSQSGTVGQVLFSQALLVTGWVGIDQLEVTGGVKVTTGLAADLGDSADTIKVGDPLAGGLVTLGGLQVNLGAGNDALTIARTTISGFSYADGGLGLDTGRDLGGNTFLRRFTSANFEPV